MNILQNPRVRVVIVIIIMLIISTGIVSLMRGLLTKPPKVCGEDTHLDENTNQCVPNCKDGFINNPITGACELECPVGQVRSKSLEDVIVPGDDRCVIPCSTGYCDPKQGYICQDDFCHIPNCVTTDGDPSYCEPGTCGTDADGNKKSGDTTLNKYGCYSDSLQSLKTAPVCPASAPDLITGTGAYLNDHVCCNRSEFAKWSSEGEPFCCQAEDDVIVNGKCCPISNKCPVNDGPTVCINPEEEVCIQGEGACKKENAIGSPGNYTGCCPYPTLNGECYNMCQYGASEKDTGMKTDICTSDSQCDFKSGFTYDSLGSESTGSVIAGGKCINGKCKLYCGPADVATQGDIACLNDPNSRTSSCINTQADCEFTPDSTHTAYGAYICEEKTPNKPPTSYWKSNKGNLTLNVQAGMENQNCKGLSCLHRMITSGLLQTTGEITNTGNQITNTGNQITLSSVAGLNNINVNDSVCTATIECDKMKILQDGKPVNWTEQTVDLSRKAKVMNTMYGVAFDGSWHGTGECIPGANPSNCVFLEDGRYAKYGTPDGINPLGNIFSGSGCEVASTTDGTQTYTPDGSILCMTEYKNGSTLEPNYYCKSWESCCGEGGLISSTDRTKCINLSNAKCNPTTKKCSYNTVTGGKGINTDKNVRGTTGYNNSTFIATYLSLDNTLTNNFTDPDSNIGNSSLASLKYSSALIVMKYDKQYIGFDPTTSLLGLVDGYTPINFYYTYWTVDENQKRLWPNGGQIPLFKGYFRFGTGQEFDKSITIPELGRPVKTTSDGAQRLKSWTGGKMFNDGDVLTLVNNNGKWYLAAGKYFYWKWSFTFGIRTGDLMYGLYNRGQNKFEFTQKVADDATPIELKYVFSSKPDAKTGDADDRFLLNTTTKKLIQQAQGIGSALTFNDLEYSVRLSAKTSD